MTLAQKEYKYNLADALIWIGIAVMIIWAIGKSFGWIHSPVWVDMLPVFGMAGAIAGIGMKVGMVLQQLKDVIAAVNKIEYEVKMLDGRVTAIENLSQRLHSGE